MCTDKICRDSSHDQHLKYVPYFQPCGSDLAMKSTEKKNRHSLSGKQHDRSWTRTTDLSSAMSGVEQEVLLLLVSGHRVTLTYHIYQNFEWKHYLDLMHKLSLFILSTALQTP